MNKFIARLTMRQKISIGIFIVLVFCTPLAWVDGKMLALVAACTCGAMLLLVLDAVEKGNQRQNSSFRGLNKRLASNQRELIEKVDNFAVDAGEKQGASSFQLDVANEELKLAAHYVNSIDKILDPVAGVPVSRIVSIELVGRALRSEHILADEKWLPAISKVSGRKVSSLTEFEAAISGSTERILVVVEEEAFADVATQLLLSPVGQSSAIGVISAHDSISEDKQIDFAAYEEIAPVPVSFGLRVFYPANRLKSEAYSRFLDYK